ncbi:MAG: polyprenyl diphosphate synthase [Actinomycetota bacterium]
MGEIYPVHIGMIMDGNGRWAKQRGLPRIEGHRQGEESIMEAVRACSSWGIHALSLFAFSTENWERPEEEVQFLVNMSRAVLRKRMEEFMELGVRMRHIGRREGLRPEILAWFDLAAEVTAGNKGLNLSINFNYGGRQEIIDASLAAAAALGEHGMEAKDIDEEFFRRFVYVPELPDIDLLIRTAGEMRISNYMLWHLADAEIIISPVLWPDFRRDQLEAALQAFRHRKTARDSDLE